MTFRINEIFFSLQGEGYWTGTPMIFIRFSGCNLQCPFCDTDHSAYKRMSAGDILAEIRRLSPPCRRICLTGGEPSLQLDSTLTETLHQAGYKLHIETNGTRPLPQGIDWITLSPKTEVPGQKASIKLEKAHELKLVYLGGDVERWTAFPAQHFFLQPCSGQNTAETVAYISQHPAWRLSLQTHKYLGIR